METFMIVVSMTMMNTAMQTIESTPTQTRYCLSLMMLPTRKFVPTDIIICSDGEVFRPCKKHKAWNIPCLGSGKRLDQAAYYHDPI